MSEQQEASAQEEHSPRGPRHSAPEGAEVHPLVDLSRDPTPGKPDHAAPDDDEDE